MGLLECHSDMQKCSSITDMWEYLSVSCHRKPRQIKELVKYDLFGRMVWYTCIKQLCGCSVRTCFCWWHDKSFYQSLFRCAVFLKKVLILRDFSIIYFQALMSLGLFLANCDIFHYEQIHTRNILFWYLIIWILTSSTDKRVSGVVNVNMALWQKL